MLKNWTKLEKILLFGSIILISAVGIIFKSDFLTTICAIVRCCDSTITCKRKKFRTNIWCDNNNIIFNSVI